MKNISLIAFLLVASLVYGGDRNGWRGPDGNKLPDTEFRKVNNDFAGQLLITPDTDWQTKWKTSPDTVPYFRESNKARIGQELAILTFFANPIIDDKGNVNVVCSIKVTRPNGTISVNQRGIACMKGKLEGAPANIRLSPAVIKFLGEQGDPLGTWFVEVEIEDVNRSTKLQLKSYFELAPEAEIESLEDFTKFITYYYQTPNPKIVVSAIEFMQQSGFPQKEEQAPPFIGFFSEIFAANKDHMTLWNAEIGKTTGKTRKVLGLATSLSQQTESLTHLDPSVAQPSMNDLCWGAYFASGKNSYLDALVSRLAYLSERKNLMLYMTASSAQWSLSSNARLHSQVKQYLETAMKNSPENIKQAINEALSKNPGEFQENSIRVLKEQHEKKIW